jgi:spoIIIJ-associated protein
LSEQAHALAAEVRADGKPRTTTPLNAYERRLIHVALSQVEGVVTYSVGEGADRRVTVAPAPPPGSPDAP